MKLAFASDNPHLHENVVPEYHSYKICRGVRGATTLKSNTREEILGSTEELLRKMTTENDIKSSDIVFVYFTATSDLDAEFPAAAARERLDWRYVPLINSVEIDVPDSMPMCIRVLLTWNTELTQREVKHIYLNDAVKLRADIADAQ